MVGEIRGYRRADLPVLGAIYADSIRHLGRSRYSEDQVAAWSSFPDDHEAFGEWIEGAATYVAVDDKDACIGFAGMEEGGRVSSVFVIPSHMRQGVGAALLKHLKEKAKAKGLSVLTAEASEFSKPLFEKLGFGVIEVESTTFKGVDFNRYAMRADICDVFRRA